MVENRYCVNSQGVLGDGRSDDFIPVVCDDYHTAHHRVVIARTASKYVQFLIDKIFNCKTRHLLHQSNLEYSSTNPIRPCEALSEH